MRFILLTFLIFFCIELSSTQAQHVSQYLNQVVSYAIDEDNPPTQLHLSLNSSNIDLQYIRGTRIMITGQVRLDLPNVFFLETLIARGRYHLYLTPDGGSGLRLEDKTRQPMILKGKHCDEKVSYILYLPETITTVVFEDKTTGVTDVVQVEARVSKALTSVKSNTQEKQVTIKNN
ncbi:MAG: hypothetical protein ACRBFS_02695 [Aureispira sp.]